jgi:hypothetical protein
MFEERADVFHVEELGHSLVDDEVRKDQLPVQASRQPQSPAQGYHLVVGEEWSVHSRYWGTHTTAALCRPDHVAK